MTARNRQKPIEIEVAILRQLCRIELDSSQRQQVCTLWTQPFRHQRLVELSERHGLANLLLKHAEDLQLDLPQECRQQLLALKIRHRYLNQARKKALEEILHQFDEYDIECVVLKGAALIYVLYPSAELRPMSDIDILVASEQAENAQQCLRQCGYQVQDNNNPYMRNHHHLPMASKQLDNTSIHVEIHTDALSGDVAQSINMTNLVSPPIKFAVGSLQAQSLGHIDMLRHLCHHTLEPIREIKLGAIADIYGYASRYLDQIDVSRLESEFSFVTNVFRLFHFLSPLPDKLLHWAPSAAVSAPDGVGAGFPPLSDTGYPGFGAGVGPGKMLSAPDWWLHCFYNVPPEKSLLPTKVVHHPLQLAKWLLRRIAARTTTLHQ